MNRPMTDPALTSQRTAVLRLDHLDRVQADKALIALAPDEVRALDRALSEGWGIDFPVTDAAGHLPAVTDRDAARRFDKAYMTVAAGRVGEEASGFYDAIAHPELFGVVTSLRRHLIIDVAALVIGLCRSLSLSGEVADIGCHGGFLGSLVADATGLRVCGIDPSAEAIAFGNSNPAMSPRVELVKASVPWRPERQFELVLSSSVMQPQPASRAAHLKNTAELLVPGGIGVIVSSAWAEADVPVLRRQLTRVGLGFGYADVVGGYGNFPRRFEAEGVCVFVKGASRDFPRKVRFLMESEWDRYFRDYANSPTTPAREKTQAFERALRQHAEWDGAPT